MNSRIVSSSFLASAPQSSKICLQIHKGEIFIGSNMAKMKLCGILFLFINLSTTHFHRLQDTSNINTH